MDIIGKFSFVDFLAYLFPGAVSTMGLYMLLLLTPLEDPLKVEIPDFLAAIIMLAISYVIGIVLSSFAELGVKKWMQYRSKIWARNTIPVPGFEADIKSAFNNVFPNGNQDKIAEWSVTHFHLCRSLVFQRMPNLAQSVIRQGSLRELRANLIPSITIWSIVGMAWGTYYIGENEEAWGLGLIFASIILWPPIASTILNRMYRNETREVREVLTAFLAGYKSGLFKQVDDNPS